MMVMVMMMMIRVPRLAPGRGLSRMVKTPNSTPHPPDDDDDGDDDDGDGGDR